MNSLDKIVEYKNYLQSACVLNSSLSEEQKKSLAEAGYCLIPYTESDWKSRGIHFDQIKKSIQELVINEGTAGGWDHKKELQKTGSHPEPGTQRLSNILSKNEIFRPFFMIPEVLAGVDQVIQAPFKLSSLSYREPLEGSGIQNLHIDWRPRRYESTPYQVAIAYIYLDDSTRENGCLRVIPGSHRRLGEPSDFGWETQKEHPDQVLVEASRGSIAIFNAHLWHGGTLNRSGKRRRSISLVYRDRRIYQQLNQKKNIPMLVQDKMSDVEKYFLAIREEDKTQNEFWYRRRNTWYVTKAVHLSEGASHVLSKVLPF